MNSGNRSGNRSGSRSENSGFRSAQVVRRHSENGILHSEKYFQNSESCSENTPERSQSSENGRPQASENKTTIVFITWIGLNCCKKRLKGQIDPFSRGHGEGLVIRGGLDQQEASIT